MTPQRARRNLENSLRRDGYLAIAGVDEVGRGCLAGPVTAAAVILPVDLRLTGICDSKQLTALARERFFGRITRHARAWAVASCTPEEIDRINIHQATLVAMRRAVLALDPPPDLVLVDAFEIPELAIPQRPVPQGDRRCTSIAAASIVAKVTRDREMTEWHRQDSRYGYDRHKGYATAEHLAALALHGYSAIHRRSFRPPSLFDTIDCVELAPDPSCENAGTPRERSGASGDARASAVSRPAFARASAARRSAPREGGGPGQSPGEQ